MEKKFFAQIDFVFYIFCKYDNMTSFDGIITIFYHVQIPSNDSSWKELQKIYWVKKFHIRSKISICARPIFKLSKNFAGFRYFFFWIRIHKFRRKRKDPRIFFYQKWSFITFSYNPFRMWLSNFPKDVTSDSTGEVFGELLYPFCILIKKYRPYKEIY